MLSRVDPAASRFSSLPSTTYRNVPGNGRSLIWQGNRLIRRNTCFQKKDGLRMKVNGGGRSVKVHAARGNSEGNELPLNSSWYHPFEEIDDPISHDGPAINATRLSDAQIARTIVEVNNKASIVMSLDHEEDGDVTFADLSYSTDEHGDIYFEVDNNDGLVEFSDDKIVKVMIGLDSSEMVVMEDQSQSMDVLDFEVEVISDDESGSDDEEYDDDDEEEDDDDEEDEVDVQFFLIGNETEHMNWSDFELNWSEFETVNSCYPVDFAKAIAEAVCDTKIDWTNHPSSGLIVEGYLRPAFSNEQTKARRNKSTDNEEKDDKDQSKADGSTSFVKVELEKIQLITACGNQSTVSITDFWGAKPDVIAHSAANIISRLKAGGEKIAQALKSLCWRQLGLQVEEACVIGVDSLGFDVKVCSNKQLQVVRFAFNKQPFYNECCPCLLLINLAGDGNIIRRDSAPNDVHQQRRWKLETTIGLLVVSTRLLQNLEQRNKCMIYCFPGFKKTSDSNKQVSKNAKSATLNHSIL